MYKWQPHGMNVDNLTRLGKSRYVIGNYSVDIKDTESEVPKVMTSRREIPVLYLQAHARPPTFPYQNRPEYNR